MSEKIQPRNSSDLPMLVKNLGNLIIIGFCGMKGVGKSTLARYTEQFLDHATTCDTDIVVYRDSFAAPIKGMLDQGLDLPKPEDGADTEIIPELGVPWRYLAQTLGTEWGRCYIGDNVWINLLAASAYEEAENDPDRTYVVIIDDVRFENEKEWIEKHSNSTLILVRDRQKEAMHSYDLHESEQLWLRMAAEIKGSKHMEVDNSTSSLSEATREEYTRSLASLIATSSVYGYLPEEVQDSWDVAIQ